MVLNNFIKAACLSTCIGLASGSVLANTVETNGGLNVYDSNDSNHWFKLSGKMQLDHNLLHEGLTMPQGALDLRAVQAKVQGGVGQDLSYSFRLKRNGNSVSLDQSQIAYSGFNSWSKVTVGEVGLPYGLNTNFTERSLAGEMFTPKPGSNAMGMALTAWNDQVGVSVSVLQPSNGLTSLSSLQSSVRMCAAPLMRDNLVLHLGANAYVQNGQGKATSYNLTNNDMRPAVFELDGSQKRRGFSLDTAVLRGPMFLQADFHQVSLGKNSQALGYSVEASYAVTGETRDYNKITGQFSSLRTENDGGSWQVSARHSGARKSNAALVSTAGASVAWTVNNNLTVLADYENALTANNQGALSLRLQAAW
jgi:phosphate-selective porin OprO/OprP